MSDTPSASAAYNASLLPGGEPPPAPTEDMSVVGALLMSAASVAMAILGMMFLGAVLVAVWWLLSHIPLPAFVHHALAAIGL